MSSSDSDLIEQHVSLQKRTLRLISLTDIIRKEMESSNNNDVVTNESTESVSLKNDLREVIQELTETYLKERRFSETYIKRQDIQQYLENWSSLDTVHETPTVDDKKESETSESSSNDGNDAKEYQEMLIEVNRDDGERKYNKIDKRLNMVEQKLNRIYKILTGKRSKSKKNRQKQKASSDSVQEEEEIKISEESLEAKANIYDEMFYEWRENAMNAGFYAKSQETLQLNKKPAGSQFVPPPSIADMFPMSQQQLNRPMFVKAVWMNEVGL